jgi:hypothetical protein
MARVTKVVGFSVPPAMMREVEQVSREEHRTKSELFREMFRLYKRYRQGRDVEEGRWVGQLIEEAQREQQENPLSKEEVLEESRRLARAGQRRSSKLGIRTTDADIVRLIHKQRASRRAKSGSRH